MRGSLCTLLILLSAACGQSESTKASRRAEAEAAMSRGTSLLEAFHYGEAREELKKAVALAPDWTDAKVNYAIALMNLTSDETTGEGLADKALGLVREIVESWDEFGFGPARTVTLKGLQGQWVLHPVVGREDGEVADHDDWPLHQLRVRE